MKYIAGIDPGKKGFVALLDNFKTPVETIKIPYNKETNRIDTFSFSDTLQCYDIDFVYVEVQGYRRFQKGVKTTLENYGRLLSIVEMLQIPYDLVEPKMWKKALGLPGGQENKAQSVDMVNRFFPKFGKVTHDEAEAILIALYGMTYLK